MSGDNRGAHRATAARGRHRRCPTRRWFPDQTSATETAQQLGSVATGCTQCSGFHLDLPTTPGIRRAGHRAIAPHTPPLLRT